MIIDGFTALPYVPEKYFYENALVTMLVYMQNKEASNWTRCTDLYKEEIHRKNITEQAIQQTELAKETRNAAHSAAASTWASAAGIWWK
jgi:hypothetical protein